MSAKKKFWIIGLVLAAVGVVLVRVVAGLYTQAVIKLVIYGLGVLLALGGLGVIMFAMRKE